MRKNVLSQVDDVIKDLGFYGSISATKILGEMQIYNFALLFLGLVFNIVIILFVIISILLIYSLLMITTETKTFDIGVMRLIGLSSGGFISMVFVQAVMFVIPSIVCAWVSSIPALWLLFNVFFDTDLTKGQVSYVPGALASFEAIGIGLLIPTLSAIIPIQRALAKSLSDSLNTARSNISGTVVVIEDRNVKVAPFIIMGILCVTAGTTIYIILPQALIAENASLILEIFFAILVGMILGLTLLTANLRGPVETFVVYLLLFWEKKSMRALVKKNLVAHKATNKLTSIIYALTLGCVIFLCVSLNLVLKSATAMNYVPGADIFVTRVNDYPDKDNDASLYAKDLDPILQNFTSSISDFGYVSNDV